MVLLPLTDFFLIRTRIFLYTSHRFTVQSIGDFPQDFPFNKCFITKEILSRKAPLDCTSRLHLILDFAKIKYPILFPPPPYSRPLFCPLDIIRNKIGVLGFSGLYFEFQQYFLVGKNKIRVPLPCFLEENFSQVLGLRGGEPVKEPAPYLAKWLTSQSFGCLTTVATLLP